MLLVVARDTDLAARRVARRWAHHGARVLTPRDLSRAGWLVGDVSPSMPAFVAGGERAGESEVRAALVRISSVSAADVSHVDAADRGYCAAEMTAFLAWWLTELRCPVVNRPTPTCLSGTEWAGPTWTIMAAELGIPCRPVRWSSVGDGWPPAAEHGRRRVPVTVVGDRAEGSSSARLGSLAVELAHAAGVEALTVWFDGDNADARFLEAQPRVDIDDPVIADLVLERLLSPQAASR